jgi:hypothetical protein
MRREASHMALLGGKISPFTEEETKGQRGAVTCPGLFSQKAEFGFEPKSVRCQSPFLPHFTKED